MGLRARGAGQGSASGTRVSPSPPTRRRVWESGTQRPNVPRVVGRRSRPPAHLSRGRPQAREPRSSRVAASTIAAILCLRPPLLPSLPARPSAPRPRRRRPSAFRRSFPVLGAEAAARGSERRPSGGRLGPRPGRSQGHGAAAAGLGRARVPGPAAMAGYARRPGVTPLSRARSLVIPDGERPGRRVGVGGGEGAPGGRPRLGPAPGWGLGAGPAGRAEAQVRPPRRAPRGAR